MRKLQKSVIEAIGGKENVSSVVHCATRLRIHGKEIKKKSIQMKSRILRKFKGHSSTQGNSKLLLGTGTGKSYL